MTARHKFTPGDLVISLYSGRYGVVSSTESGGWPGEKMYRINSRGVDREVANRLREESGRKTSPFRETVAHSSFFVAREDNLRLMPLEIEILAGGWDGNGE